MTDENIDSDARRSFMKKGAAATTALAIGASGTAAAQQGDDGVGEAQKGLLFTDAFRPLARFAFVSGVLDWTPDVEEVQDNVWSQYNTRMIRYLNTGERVPMFVAQNAEVGPFDEQLGFVTDDQDPQQPQVYELSREATLFGDTPRLVTVNFSPVGEQEEDDILDNEAWWQNEGA